jgi:hypothetical protein
VPAALGLDPRIAKTVNSLVTNAGTVWYSMRAALAGAAALQVSAAVDLCPRKRSIRAFTAPAVSGSGPSRVRGRA